MIYEIYAKVFPLSYDGEMKELDKIVFERRYNNIIFAFMYYRYLLRKLKPYAEDKNFFVMLPELHARKE